MKKLLLISSLILMLIALSCKNEKKSNNNMPETTSPWEIDFFDDFKIFNPDNWQDQRIWVNNENHCYVPDGEYGTREVSDGTLKIKVVKIDEKRPCDNFDKHGNQHPDTEYVAGRICSKNRKEFIKGKWTARLKLSSNGEASMFPAWWLLGAQNNEPPVQEPDENVCWPLPGSGEIDIMEHVNHSPFADGTLHYNDNGHTYITANTLCDVEEFHLYSVEWDENNITWYVDSTSCPSM